MVKETIIIWLFFFLSKAWRFWLTEVHVGHFSHSVTIFCCQSQKCSFSHKIYSFHAVSVSHGWEDVNFLGPFIFSFQGILPKLVFACGVLICFHVLVCEACKFWMPDIQVESQSLWKGKKRCPSDKLTGKKVEINSFPHLCNIIWLQATWNFVR